MTCVRQAWLELDGNTIQLEDEAGAGWILTQLDLGYPAVRAVVQDRPDQDGSDDRTLLFGSRAVSANITALQDIDAVAASFAPYMVPSKRPTLHYILDTPGAPERTLGLRAAGYSAPIAGTSTRDLQLQWIAGDPVSRGPWRQAASHSGSSTSAGRGYALGFDRTYPSGGSSGTTSVIHSDGDTSVQPQLIIYGPVNAPKVTITGPTGEVWTVGFVPGFNIGDGQWVTIDTLSKVALYNGDFAQNVLPFVDWANVVWPYLPVGVDNVLSITGSSGMTPTTQVIAQWRDGFLS